MIFYGIAGWVYVYSQAVPGNRFIASLQLSQNRLGITACNPALLSLLSIGDLAVIDDDGVAAGALAHGPADGLGELGLAVGCEELWASRDASAKLRVWLSCCAAKARGSIRGWKRGGLFTMKSSVTPFALPQALMTKASL